VRKMKQKLGKNLDTVDPGPRPPRAPLNQIKKNQKSSFCEGRAPNHKPKTPASPTKIEERWIVLFFEAPLP